MIRRPIGEVEVAQILAIRDPVLRNLWITLAYHDDDQIKAMQEGRVPAPPI